jgi:hypothetical protein
MMARVQQVVDAPVDGCCAFISNAATRAGSVADVVQTTQMQMPNRLKR